MVIATKASSKTSTDTAMALITTPTSPNIEAIGRTIRNTETVTIS